jgi:hypothetical protein
MHFQRRLHVVAVDRRDPLRHFGRQAIELPTQVRDRSV